MNQVKRYFKQVERVERIGRVIESLECRANYFNDCNALNDLSKLGYVDFGVYNFVNTYFGFIEDKKQFIDNQLTK